MTMTLPIAVWTTGRPVPEAEKARGSFFDMIADKLVPADRGRLRNFDCVAGDQLPPPDEVAAVIVTGSPAHVAERAGWMLETERRLADFAASSTPVLGICFGHQLLGNALGGRSGTNPAGREIGTIDLVVDGEDELLSPALEPDEVPHVVMTHLDSVLELPPGAVAFAHTGLERYAAIRFAPRVWGVQFHPEMDHEIVGHYIEARRDQIAEEGLDPDHLLASRRPSDLGGRLLRRFVELAG